MTKTATTYDVMRRRNVLDKIKLKKDLWDIRVDVIKITNTSHVGYVYGRYDPRTYLYEYRYSDNAWLPELETSVDIIADKRLLNLHSSNALEKGYFYSLSKVFYAINSRLTKNNTNSVKYISSIKLTKPNHYEMLSAVVTSI